MVDNFTRDLVLQDACTMTHQRPNYCARFNELTQRLAQCEATNDAALRTIARTQCLDSMRNALLEIVADYQSRRLDAVNSKAADNIRRREFWRRVQFPGSKQTLPSAMSTVSNPSPATVGKSSKAVVRDVRRSSPSTKHKPVFVLNKSKPLQATGPGPGPTTVRPMKHTKLGDQKQDSQVGRGVVGKRTAGSKKRKRRGEESSMSSGSDTPDNDGGTNRPPARAILIVPGEHTVLLPILALYQRTDGPKKECFATVILSVEHCGETLREFNVFVGLQQLLDGNKMPVWSSRTDIASDDKRFLLLMWSASLASRGCSYASLSQCMTAEFGRVSGKTRQTMQLKWSDNNTPLRVYTLPWALGCMCADMCGRPGGDLPKQQLIEDTTFRPTQEVAGEVQLARALLLSPSITWVDPTGLSSTDEKHNRDTYTYLGQQLERLERIRQNVDNKRRLDQLVQQHRLNPSCFARAKQMMHCDDEL